MKPLLISLYIILTPLSFRQVLLAQQRNWALPESPRVAVVSAFQREISPLLSAASVQYTKTINGRTYYLDQLAENDVVLVLLGVGLSTSASTTQTLIDSFSVGAILFSGVAGGINPDLRIGDVTIPALWRQADVPGDLDEGWFSVDERLLSASQTVPGSIELDSCTATGICLDYSPEVITGGKGVSNTYFVDEADYRDWLWDSLRANVVDMETSAVAEVAHRNEIPFLAIRCISDLAGDSSSYNQLQTFRGLASDNAAAVAIRVLGAWSQLLVSIDEPAFSPTGFPGLRSYPNPFNPATTIRYDLPEATAVSLTVYDLLGREVVRLVDDYLQSGHHKAVWNADNSPSGIYLAWLVTPEYHKAIKMLLLK